MLCERTKKRKQCKLMQIAKSLTRPFFLMRKVSCGVWGGPAFEDLPCANKSQASKKKLEDWNIWLNARLIRTGRQCLVCCKFSLQNLPSRRKTPLLCNANSNRMQGSCPLRLNALDGYKLRSYSETLNPAKKRNTCRSDMLPLSRERTIIITSNKCFATSDKCITTRNKCITTFYY